jgi:hypothetical protein
MTSNYDSSHPELNFDTHNYRRSENRVKKFSEARHWALASSNEKSRGISTPALKQQTYWITAEEPVRLVVPG